MAYTPQTWVDNNASYPLSAARMNTMESGIAAAASVADQGHRILTTAERDALGAVTAGTTIYNSTLTRVQTYYDGAWVDGDTFRTVGANTYNNVIVPPMVSATITANQSIANTTWAFISFTSEGFDTDGMFAPTDTKITIQTGGIYLVTAQIGFATNGTGDRLIKIEKNAATPSNGTPLLSSFVDAIAVSDTHTTMSGLLSLSASDTLHMTVYQNSGGALNTAANPYPLLQATWVGRTS